MTRVAARRRPLARHLAVAFCSIALASFAAGCTDVKEGLEKADDTLSGTLLGAEGAQPEDSGEAPLTETDLATSLYESGLKLKSEGKDAEAFDRFRSAADRGHAGAAYELGEAYGAGRGVDQDTAAGARWTNTAAERGDPRAQYAIGAAYYNGEGVGQDFGRAVEYLGKAAEQGHADAQFLLGECYANGRGVTKNLSWAARWYGKAAAQGHAEGAFSYGVVQAAGLGVPVDMPLGYGWLDIASDRGHAKAGEVRAAIANKMTPEEIERGKRYAAAFTPDSGAAFADRPTVRYVQHSLNQLGFTAGSVDGLMGPRTRSAIQAYLTSIGDSGSSATVTPALLQRLRESQRDAA